MTSKNDYDDNYLDSLLEDLGKATENIPSSRKSPSMNSSYTTTTVEQTPNRKVTTTISKYEYNKTNLNKEPIYQNENFDQNEFKTKNFSTSESNFKKTETNMSELNSFLNEFKTEKDSFNKYNLNGYSNGQSKYETYSKKQTSESSQQVNQLISNLERNLANPVEAMKWRGEQIKPITMTEYYEETKKESSLGGRDGYKTYIESSKPEKITSISPSKVETQINSKSTSYSKYYNNDNKNLENQNYNKLQNSSSQQSSSYRNVNQSYDSSADQNLNFQSSINQKINRNYSNHHQNSNELASQKTSQTYNQNKQARASDATHELDDLMASLGDFKLKDQKSSQSSVLKHSKYESSNDVPDYASINKHRNAQEDFRSSSNYNKIIKQTKESSSRDIKNLEPLENIIGSIEIEMNKQGVETLAKGSCFTCQKPIVGQVITALARTYHPEHFTCAYCNETLGERTFFERDGNCYCEPDYHRLFAPKCSYCLDPITGRQKCVSALNQTFHAEHFFCAECQIQFTEEKGYHEHKGQAYCANCYLNVFAQKCTSCEKPITSAFISALGGQWHPECFVCTQCKCEFASGAFFEYEGKPYCETHFHAKKGTLCAGCHKPITGRCVTAMFRKFHPEHFVCSYCLKPLNKGTFKEQNDKPYCHSCFERVFS